jgi:hypothetical protein
MARTRKWLETGHFQWVQQLGKEQSFETVTCHHRLIPGLPLGRHPAGEDWRQEGQDAPGKERKKEKGE